MTEIIKNYIEGKFGKVAFRCRSLLEVETLFDTVRQIIEPSRHGSLYSLQNAYGHGFFKDEICFRIERHGDMFGCGHDHVSYYQRIDYEIIDVVDLFTPNDYGVFEIDEANIDDLLLNVIKA